MVEIEGDFDYYIIDVSGKIIINSRSQNKNIQLANIPNGYYILKIQNKGHLYSTPLIIRK